MDRYKINKRALHHHYKQVRFIRPWYFFLAALIFFFLGVLGLRQNNLHMVELREKVAAADKQGENVEKPLAELRNYVYSHMNTDLSGGPHGIGQPIQLKSEYERLVKEGEKNLAQTNEEVKARAESICARKHPERGYNSPRVACVQSYVQQNARQSGDIPKELYTFDFVSPKWTPDFAGISLVLGVLFSVLFLIWLGLERWVRSRID